MFTVEIFLTQLLLSLFTYTLLARWVISPWLKEKAAYLALMILIAPHATRHIGLTFLVPSVTDPAIPQGFAMMAALGDFASGLLAIASLVALKIKWRFAIPLVWFFSLVGTLDLLNALSQAEAIPTLAGTWYIPTFWVPLLLVTHFMIFQRLIKNGTE